MKSNILVFPCGSEIGLEIHNSLKFSSQITLFGASTVNDHGMYVYKNYIGDVPFVSSPYFIEHLIKIVKKNSIDYVFPAHDDVALKLSQDLEKLPAKVLTSDKTTNIICRSKLKTYIEFNSIVRVPRVFSKNDIDMQFPVFLKPESGQGSKGVQIARTKEELDYFISKNQELIILEYLPGKEYTIDCFTDRKRKLRFVGGRERIRIQNGISVNTKADHNPIFYEYAQRINSKLNLRGAWFFQLKKSTTEEFVLMEIAPRIAGSMGYHRNLGVNLPLLTVFDAMNKDVEVIKNDYKLTMDRSLTNKFFSDITYKTVYLDLDDCIINSDKINWQIIAFIYQCLNKKVKINLLTKHENDINKTLKDFRISELFDAVVNIKKNQEKTEFIKEKSSIFIDDSFSERAKVFNKHRIPVFDLSEVECLIDWRM